MNFAEDIISPSRSIAIAAIGEQRWNSGEFDGGPMIAFDEISP